MDHSERYEMNEEARIEDEFQCECCLSLIDGIAAIDPIVIDGRTFCDSCASDLTLLRFEEYIDRVSNKTKKLK